MSQEKSPYQSIPWAIARGALTWAAFLVVGAFIVLLAWNNGITHVSGLHDITFTTAFWLNVALLFVSTRFRGRVNNILVPPPQR